MVVVAGCSGPAVTGDDLHFEHSAVGFIERIDPRRQHYRLSLPPIAIEGGGSGQSYNFAAEGIPSLRWFLVVEVKRDGRDIPVAEWSEVADALRAADFELTISATTGSASVSNSGGYPGPWGPGAVGGTRHLSHTDPFVTASFGEPTWSRMGTRGW